MKKLLFLILVGSSLSAWSWSPHGPLTKEALSVLPELSGVTATYQNLDDILPKMNLAYNRNTFGPAISGSADAVPVLRASDLNLYLRLKRDSNLRTGYVFAPRLGEVEGKVLTGLEILSHYSDEPDGWSDTHKGDEPDTCLFDDDQYPNLWRKEYSKMGGRVCKPDEQASTATQAFRHMYWPKWSIWNPIATFKLPIGKLTKPMGQAHERLDAYMAVSRAALKAGSRYWQLRFLANGLHYLEDATQAFHVSQTPSKKFILMAGFSDVTNRVTNIISYYHFAYEDFIGRIFKTPGKYPKAHATFSEALKSSTSTTRVIYPGAYLALVAKESISRSPKAAKTAMKFFPPIGKRVNLSHFNPEDLMNAEWWDRVEKSAEGSSKAQRKYFESVEESFKLFGKSVRNLVRTELTPQ